MRIELGIQPTWMRKGLCREVDADMFFPEHYANEREVREAKRVCRQCDVNSACLEFAMSDMTLQGIWGVLSDRERAMLAAARDRNRRVRAI